MTHIISEIKYSGKALFQDSSYDVSLSVLSLDARNKWENVVNIINSSKTMRYELENSKSI